jgi:uncharacterized protein
LAGASVAWGWFEAGWVRLRTLDVLLRGLPGELEGLRIVHLADFHLGRPSRGRRAVETAVEWSVEREPDLVCISGDLVSHPGGERVLRELLEPLGDRCYAVLGNHDVEHSRDPFSRSAGLHDLSPAHLLVDEAETIELRGRRVQIVGVDPRTYRQRRAEPWRHVDGDAELRISSATSRTSSIASRRAPSTSCSPAISTTARSRSPTDSESSGSRT